MGKQLQDPKCTFPKVLEFPCGSHRLFTFKGSLLLREKNSIFLDLEAGMELEEGLGQPVGHSCEFRTGG